MTFLPIVERELRVAARLPATYRNRALTAGVVAAVAVLMMLFASMTSSPAYIGGTAFWVLSILTLCFCLLEGVRKTADCLSEEKREGTLGLLFLTDLKGYDVVFGKLAATSLNSFYGLVAILPVLALPLLLGGVTPGEYWRVVLALLNILFFSLCAGMAVSACSVEQQQAMGRTLLVIILICAVPLLTFTRALFPFSPVYGFRAAFEGYYAGAHNGYWETLAITPLWSCLLLVGASIAVPRSWREGNAGGQWQSRRRGRLYWRAWHMESREEMLAVNPIWWLAGRDQRPVPALNLSIVAALAGAGIFAVAGKPEFLPAYLAGVVILNFFLKMLLAAQATQFFTEARRENDLEMLLATPLRVDQFVSGQLRALERLFVAPLIAILSIEFAGAFIGITVAAQRGPVDAAYGALIIGGGLYLAMFLADVAAVTWAGMWFGLTAKKESQAATKTILFVLVAPLVALLLWCPGYIAFVGIPIFWLGWARLQVYKTLGKASRKGYALGPVDFSKQLRPGFGALQTPPIIKP